MTASATPVIFATYESTLLLGANKTGKMKPDGDGYYDVVLGAVNFSNQSGHYYPAEPFKKIFGDPQSSLMRRINGKTLRGEAGHPRKDGMTDQEFLWRVLDIREQCVSHHIKGIELSYGAENGPDGTPVVIVHGRIIPSGPFGPALQKQIDNPNENVCFSIRSITDDEFLPTGRRVKYLQQIVTWDSVNEPGIRIANKFDNPALEQLVAVSQNSFNINFTDLKTLAEDIRKGVGKVSMESEAGILIAETLKNFKSRRESARQTTRILTDW